MAYDVFISYRRLGGEYTAKIVKDRLVGLGYNVFFDVESLRSGNFNQKLYQFIEECKDFILILAPDSLDRCVHEDDWVRLEIAHAMKHNLNIIPIMLRGFEFPEILPPEIASLKYKNGIEANMEFFDAFIHKLEGFLIAKPSVKSRISHSFPLKGILPVFMVILLLCVMVGGVGYWYLTREKDYLVTQVEKNLSKQVLAHIELSLVQVNQMIEVTHRAYITCQAYLNGEDDITYDKALIDINLALEVINASDYTQHGLSEDVMQELDNSPFNRADLVTFNLSLEQFKKDFGNNLFEMKHIISQDSSVEQAIRKQYIALQLSYLAETANLIANGVNLMLVAVDVDYSKDFRENFIPHLSGLMYDEYQWSDDREVLKKKMRDNLDKIESILMEMTRLIGGSEITNRA